jgi:hypothetical protein
MASASLGRRPMRLAACLFLLAIGYASNASAQVAIPPMKEIVIYNNSEKDTIFPMLDAFTGNVDLWMQAQLRDQVSDVNTQTFCNNSPVLFTSCPPGGGATGKPPTLFRAYINPDKGIRPREFVSITVPFYTQLTATNPATIGKSSGQYIDWWNAQRIFFYDGETAVSGAFNYNVDQDGHTVPPTPVNPIGGAMVPSCAQDNMFNCEPVTLVSYVSIFPTGSIPFDLGEYTFAAAEGPPPGGLRPVGSALTINLKRVNFNISAVDGVYLPVAMAALGNTTPEQRVYLGTVTPVETVRAFLKTFSNSGASWPYYWPSYFAKAAPTTALPDPPTGELPYPLPKVPSANVVFAESYKVPAPVPPVLSSDTNGTPMLGTSAQALVTLWTHCTTSNDSSPTCKKIRNVFAFFSTNYLETCHLGPPLPDTPTLLRDVYGWAEFPGCVGGPLAATPGYDTAIADFCELQYNYLTNAPPNEIFNPYARLIHDTVKTNAYSFSIDDKAAFLGVPGDGLIITIGGKKGLAYPDEQYPLPTLATLHKFCH